MGIHGLLSQIGPGERIALAKLSAQHYTKHNRPLRLAIDISIWLFQIQSGKGGSNPALRTFYYRLLRLLSLNIWPLFVFDGPNKPLFKRNKKVGGPGVRVASVPEFLAKQLLKQFGFPWHVAPGEAEAECALLQREGVVDAVLSEDVDTLMFGSGITIRNWTSENTTKSPTHVNVYRSSETKERSGLDREGMILVALMSGGDYLPEGIPGCGPKVACDAARAGFATDLCALSKRDTAGIKAWKDRLQHEIRTNEAKHFSRKNTNFTIPDDFPNLQVLGYYTQPCVSTAEKVARLKSELTWDQSIDFAALRIFTADAFDWRCIGGAKKFIKNLAPAMLIRELRLRSDGEQDDDIDVRQEIEKQLVRAITTKRNHSTADGELEYRICFLPSTLVPIDLSIEDEDDQFIPAGAEADASDAESEFMTLPSSTQGDDNASEAPSSPSKKRAFKPFDPTQPEKLWILKTFLQIGCPLLVEDYEASFTDPREFLKARRDARAAAKPNGNIHAPRPKKPFGTKRSDSQVNTLASYAKVTKPDTSGVDRDVMKGLSSSQTNIRPRSQDAAKVAGTEDEHHTKTSRFRLPATQIPAESSDPIDVLDLACVNPSANVGRAIIHSKGDADRPFAAFSQPKKIFKQRAGRASTDLPATPKRNKKRPSRDLSSPAVSQRTITSYYSPSPWKPKTDLINVVENEIIDLLSSSPQNADAARTSSPSPAGARLQSMRQQCSPAREEASPKLPGTVTKRRRKEPLKRWQTEPVLSMSEDGDHTTLPLATFVTENRCQASLDLERTPRAPHDVARPPSDLLLQDEDDSNTREKVGSWLDGVDEGRQKRADSLHSVPVTARTSAKMKPSVLKGSKQKPPTLTALPLRQSPNKPTAAAANQPTRRSPRQAVKKKRIELRESLEGWWKEVDAEAVDMSGDGSGWKKSKGTAKIIGSSTRPRNWRQSGVDILDLTGA